MSKYSKLMFRSLKSRYLFNIMYFYIILNYIILCLCLYFKINNEKVIDTRISIGTVHIRRYLFHESGLIN